MPFFFILFFLFSLAFSIEIYSQNLEKSPEGLIKAEGEVEVYHKSYYIKADTITYDPNSKTVYAVGNVYVRSLRGDFEVKGKEAFVNLEQDRGYFLNAEGRFEQFNLTAEKVEKEGEFYRIQRGSITTCPAEDREMTLCFARATISQKYVFSQGNSLRLFNLPIAYIPVAFFPVGERRSGLLPPMLGTNTYNNFIYQQPVYWAISKDKDATLTLDFRDKQAKGLVLEYRQSINRPLDLTGSFSLYREPLPPGRWWQGRNPATFRENRYRLRGDLKLGNLKLALDLVSDPYFMEDVYFSIQEKTVPYLSSFLSYKKETDLFLLILEARRFYDTTSSSNRRTLQRLPEAWLHLKEQRLFEPLYFNLSMSYVNFYREEGQRTHRLLLFPEFSLPKRVLGLNLLSRLRFENLLYLDAHGGAFHDREIVGSFRYRESLPLQFSLQRGNFQSRNFLELSYSYRPRSYRNPRFDLIDQINRESLLGYTLRSLGYYSGRPLYTFLMEGGYSYTGGFTYLNQEVRERLLPVRLVLSLQPTDWLKIATDSSYSPASGRILRTVSSLNLSDGRNTLTLGRILERQYDGRLLNDQYSVSATVNYRTLTLGVSLVRDNRTDRDLQRQISLDYRGACWSAGLMARDLYESSSNKHIKEVFLVFNIFDLQRFTVPLKR